MRQKIVLWLKPYLMQVLYHPQLILASLTLSGTTVTMEGSRLQTSSLRQRLRRVEKY
jgi:hypothetical protein